MNSTRKEIDSLLLRQTFSPDDDTADMIFQYAASISLIEKSIVVVSDLKYGKSRIFHGGFAESLGLTGGSTEDSIWEKEILERLSPSELDEKYMAELRFYNYLRHQPRGGRDNYYLASHIRMADRSGNQIDILHRMYYWYDNGSEAIRFGICIYGPMVFNMASRSLVVDSLTGQCEELSSKNDNSILSVREKQVLIMIEQGFTSQEIADKLYISKNTVSRHRQEILAKLQVKNSTQACRRAKQLRIIG